MTSSMIETIAVKVAELTGDPLTVIAGLALERSGKTVPELLEGVDPFLSQDDALREVIRRELGDIASIPVEIAQFLRLAS